MGRQDLFTCSPQLRLPLVVLAALAAALLGCEDCAREGCDSLAQRAPQQGTGLAGVVAESSDVVVNGCSECAFGTATLQAWRVDAPMSSGPALEALVAARAPDWQEQVSERYHHALEPGSYVLCVQPSCINLSIAEGETLTANIKRREGPTSFFVGSADTARLPEDFGLELGRE